MAKYKDIDVETLLKNAKKIKYAFACVILNFYTRMYYDLKRNFK